MLPPQSSSLPFGFAMCGSLASYPLFLHFLLRLFYFIFLFAFLPFFLRLIVYLSRDDIFRAASK